MHPVLELIHDRHSSGSQPLHRTEDARLAVVLEGGSSRAAFGGGMVSVLEELDLLHTVDAVYGSSAGALNGAWLVCQKVRANIHGWWAPETMGAIIQPRNALRRRPVVNGDALVDEVYETLTPMGYDEILASDVEYHPTGTDADTGASTDLAPFIHDKRTLQLALKATTRLPVLSGPPIELGGRRFIDGGLAEGVPVAMALAQGATHLLVLRTRAAQLAPIRTHPLKQRAVSRWLARHAAGASDTWISRNQTKLELEQMMARAPNILQVHPPADAPSISVVGQSAEVQERAVRMGEVAMREALQGAGTSAAG